MINRKRFSTLACLLLVTLGFTATSNAANGPVVCAIQTYSGNYLTAVGGGGRINDVLHSDATRIGAWEKFTLIDTGEGLSRYGIQTRTGHFLTAVSGGGRNTDVVHTDAPWLRDWEKFTLISLGNGWYAIKTLSGHYMSAIDGGGRTSDVIQSNRTQIQAWEKFKFICGL